jgi:hypothetical protein
MGKGVRWKMGQNTKPHGGGVSEGARCNSMDVIEVPSSKITFGHLLRKRVKIMRVQSSFYSFERVVSTLQAKSKHYSSKE